MVLQSASDLGMTVTEASICMLVKHSWINCFIIVVNIASIGIFIDNTKSRKVRSTYVEANRYKLKLYNLEFYLIELATIRST